MAENTLAPAEQAGANLEKVLLQGDLSQLTPDERVSYYRKVCESLGLNPLTKPFDYITLQGKLKLYALRSCTEQLRQIHKISVTLQQVDEAERLDGIHQVRAVVTTPDGRRDEDVGAVVIKGLSGEALANAVMKCATKAKRRATLGICGLAFLDESELDTVSGARRGEPAPAKQLKPEPPRERVDPETGEVVPRPEGNIPTLPGGPFEGHRLDDFKNVPREYLEAIKESAQDETIRAWARWLTAKVGGEK